MLFRILRLERVGSFAVSGASLRVKNSRTAHTSSVNDVMITCYVYVFLALGTLFYWYCSVLLVVFQRLTPLDGLFWNFIEADSIMAKEMLVDINKIIKTVEKLGQ